MTAILPTLRFVVLGRPQGKGSKQVMPVKGPRRFVVRDASPRAPAVGAGRQHRRPRGLPAAS